MCSCDEDRLPWGYGGVLPSGYEGALPSGYEGALPSGSGAEPEKPLQWLSKIIMRTLFIYNICQSRAHWYITFFISLGPKKHISFLLIIINHNRAGEQSASFIDVVGACHIAERGGGASAPNAAPPPCNAWQKSTIMDLYAL